MKTDDLIRALSQELTPAKPLQPLRKTAVATLAGAIIAAIVLVITMRVRTDFGENITSVLLKAAFSALIAAIALPAVLRLGRPGAPIGWRIIAIAGGLLLSLMIAGLALLGEEPGRRIEMWLGGGFPWCVVLIPVLAAPVAALLMWVVRDLAPTRLAMTGAAIGAFSGGVAAAVYAMHCPVDSVAFVTTWYALGIAVAAVIGALLAGRLLRW